MTITVRYFKEDTAHPEVPAVGNYITLTGKADRIDPVFRTLQVGDTVVPFEDLVEVLSLIHIWSMPFCSSCSI